MQTVVVKQHNLLGQFFFLFQVCDFDPRVKLFLQRFCVSLCKYCLSEVVMHIRKFCRVCHPKRRSRRIALSHVPITYPPSEVIII